MHKPTLSNQMTERASDDSFLSRSFYQCRHFLLMEHTGFGLPSWFDPTGVVEKEIDEMGVVVRGIDIHSAEDAGLLLSFKLWWL